MAKWWEKLPYSAEIYWHLVRRRSLESRGRINNLKRFTTRWVAEAQRAAIKPVDKPKKILLFTNVPIWMKHSTLLAAAYAGMGHEVTLAYFPHEDWFTEQTPFQLRLRNLQVKSALEASGDLFKTVSWYGYQGKRRLPTMLVNSVNSVTDMDYQYTHQVEEVDEDSAFYSWRWDNNYAAARAAYNWMKDHSPDVVIVPNGLILEFGAVYSAAAYMEIPVVTYEFGEQRDRIWLGQDIPVMLQETGGMWYHAKHWPLEEEQRQRIEELYASRMQAGLWRNFVRQWQDAPSEGGEAARARLGLDDRPIVLLAANVIGDSLTLMRQVFSATMTEWIERTLDYFKGREDLQFVLRVHPGERYTDGPSVKDIVSRLLPEVPEHFRIIAADDPVNTYDLIAAADLGLVYTTTVGMEMAMSGLPAIVVGRTHYRDRGFTHDPATWEDYFGLLDSTLEGNMLPRLTPEQIETAWKYAYHFYFTYPRPFPWHLRNMAEDMEAWPIDKVLSDDDMHGFRSTFEMLLRRPAPWERSK